MALIVCSDCGQHVFRAAACCPHCDAELNPDASSARMLGAAALLGLAIAGCSGDGDGDSAIGVELMYGVADTGMYVDDDGDVNITDAVYLLNFLFIGNRTPPAPFPGCGPDPTAGELNCETVPANCR